MSSLLNFSKETIDNLPQKTILKGLLVDKGFFLKIIGSMCVFFTMRLKKRCPLDKWEHDRRFIFIRHEKLVEPKNKDQMSLKGLGAIYSYQAIVNNLNEDIPLKEC